jgi:hypothetical protein
MKQIMQAPRFVGRADCLETICLEPICLEPICLEPICLESIYGNSADEQNGPPMNADERR